MERAEEYLSLTDAMYQFPPKFIGRVAEEALQFRGQVSQGARDSLNAAINNSNIRLDGFRDVSKADAETLAGPVFDEMVDGNERLLRSVWRTWMETREVLRAQVAESLGGLGVPTEGIQGKGNGTMVLWEEEDWKEQLEVIRSEVGDADELDVRLMMTCVSGMSPDLLEEEELESEMLKGWLETLRALPADAPEWSQLEQYIGQVGEIADAKAVELIRGRHEKLESLLQDSQEKFKNELSYLEIDLEAWVDDVRQHPVVSQLFLRVMEALHASLSDYAKLWAIGKTRSDEIKRRVERDQCEDFILGLAEEWRELVRIEEEAEDGDKDDGGTPASSESELPDAEESPETEVAAATIANEAVFEELEEERRESGRLREEKAELESERRGLQVKVSDMEGEVDRLRRELYESQQTEKLWREQFVSVSKSVSGEKEEAPQEIGNVEEAVEMARRAFPQQLVVALNSKSDVETPFQRPEEVYTVLAWLGTEYHRARTREMGRDPQFDRLLKEACSGWFYKPKQTDETKDQFPEWYRTRVGDREYELDAHVGKGTSYDPQNTIRVGFDWDDEEKRVVVGYIGRHQKNRRS